MNAKPDWSIADADELYRISGWGAGYFRLNADGNLVINAPLASGKTLKSPCSISSKAWKYAAKPCP